MEHLVYIHDAGTNGTYRIESGDSREITKPCDICGKTDEIYLSWQEGKREEVLDRFLKGNDKSSVDVIKSYKAGQTKDDLVLGTRLYFTITREMINGLYASGSIDKEKQLELLKGNKQTEKNQLSKIKRDTIKYRLRNILKP